MTEEQVAVAHAIHKAGLYGDAFDEVIGVVEALFQVDHLSNPDAWLRCAFNYWKSLREERA